jgi:hypothetical protein
MPEQGESALAPGRGNPLAAWCRAVEKQLADASAERNRLTEENETLRSRVDELTGVLRALQEAYLLGKLRAAGGLSPSLIRAIRERTPATDPSRTPTTGQKRAVDPTERVKPQGG